MAKVLERDTKETKNAASKESAKESRESRDAKKGKDLHTLINQQVANWAILHIKLHQHHWYVKGTNFFELHVKFEELYNEAALTLDQIAERLLSVKGTPLSTTKEFAEATTLKEHPPLKSAEDMVASIVADYRQVIEETKEIMELAEEEGDEGTHDQLLALTIQLEKHVWMLDSYLGR